LLKITFTIFLLRPVTPAAESWVEKFLPEDRISSLKEFGTTDWRWRDVVLACIRIRNFDYVGIQDVVDRVQTGATVKARLPATSRQIKPDLRAQAEKLIADGMMPDLDSVLDVVGQIRKEYQPKILEVRRQARIHRSEQMIMQ
jgi:CheY-like chemotaxis protein